MAAMEFSPLGIGFDKDGYLRVSLETDFGFRSVLKNNRRHMRNHPKWDAHLLASAAQRYEIEEVNQEASSSLRKLPYYHEGAIAISAFERSRFAFEHRNRAYGILDDLQLPGQRDPSREVMIDDELAKIGEHIERHTSEGLRHPTYQKYLPLILVGFEDIIADISDSFDRDFMAHLLTE